MTKGGWVLYGQIKLSLPFTSNPYCNKDPETWSVGQVMVTKES